VIGHILIGQNHFYVKMLFNRDSTIQKCSKNSALFTSQRFWFPASRPDDVSSRLDTHLSIVPAVRTTCHTIRMPNRPKPHPTGRRGFTIRTLLCIEKLLFQLASVRTSQQPVQTTLSDRLASDFFSSSNKGRLLQPSGQRGFPSGRAHP
jgi:hypothetical protein